MCSEILYRVWRFDLEFENGYGAKIFSLFDPGFASHLVVEFYLPFGRGILFARKGLNFIMKFRIV